MSKQIKKFKSGQLKEIVLGTIAEQLIQMRSYPSPSLPVLLGLLIKLILEKRREKISKEQITRVFKNLEDKNLIKIEERGDKAFVWINERGKPKILEYSLKKLIDYKKRQKKWKARWYLVFFDVPEIQRNKRDYLRRLLKKIGFYQYQKSVYLFPYECEKEIILIKKIVEGAKYMKYIIAEKIEDEEQAKRFFKL